MQGCMDELDHEMSYSKYLQGVILSPQENVVISGIPFSPTNVTKDAFIEIINPWVRDNINNIM